MAGGGWRHPQRSRKQGLPPPSFRSVRPEPVLHRSDNFLPAPRHTPLVPVSRGGTTGLIEYSSAQGPPPCGRRGLCASGVRTGAKRDVPPPQRLQVACLEPDLWAPGEHSSPLPGRQGSPLALNAARPERGAHSPDKQEWRSPRPPLIKPPAPAPMPQRTSGAAPG